MNNNKLSFFKGLVFGLVFSTIMWTGIVWSIQKAVSHDTEVTTKISKPIVFND